MSVALALTVAAVTLLGLVGSSPGAAVVRLADSGAWLWSSAKGWVTHVNGPSGTPDFNVALPGSSGHRVELTQDGVSVLVTDLDTGVVSRIDPATMGLLSRPFGLGSVRVVASGELAYVVDTESGTVTRIDPRTLDVIGSPVVVGAPVTGAGIDSDGVLWVSVAASGELVAIRDGRVLTRVGVAEPGARLTMTVAGGRPVAVDATAPALVPVSTTGPGPPVSLPPPAGSARGLLVASSVAGRVVPVLVEGTSVVLLVDLDSDSGDGSVQRIDLASQDPSAALGAPVIDAGRVYVPDNDSGQVLVYDRAGKRFDEPIQLAGGPGMLTLFVRNGTVWVNNADGSDAVAIGPDGSRRQVNKYSPDVAVPVAAESARVPPPPQVVPSAPAVVVPPVPRPAPPDAPLVTVPPSLAPPPVLDPSRPPDRRPTVPPATIPTTTTPRTIPPPVQQAPGVPVVSVESASAAVVVTVSTGAGGPVTEFTVTATPGGTTALDGPGNVTVPVADCADVVVTATATGPGGTSASSTPDQAIGCVPPGPIENVTSETFDPGDGWPSDRYTWQPPNDTGGGEVDYVINVFYSEFGGVPAHDVTSVVTEPLYERDQPAGRDPYSSIRIAARNAAGTGPEVYVYGSP